MEKEIDLKKLFTSILQHIVPILCISAAFGAIAFFACSFLITPTYNATATMYVYNATSRVDNITTSDLATSQKLIETYTVILKSNTVLDAVAQKLDGQYTPTEIRKMMSATSVDNTEVFSITITNKDPATAQKIVNAIANIAPIEIIRIVKAGSVEVIDHAPLPEKASFPNTGKTTALALFAGFFVCVAVVVIRALFDTTIHEEEDLIAEFDIAIIAAIPNIISENT